MNGDSFIQRIFMFQILLEKFLSHFFRITKGYSWLIFFIKSRTISEKYYYSSFAGHSIRRKFENKTQIIVPRCFVFAGQYSYTQIACYHANDLWFMVLRARIPPYSEDLAPSDYHSFPKLKKNLEGRKFSVNEALISVEACLLEQDEILLQVLCKNKRIQFKGDYIKW